MIVWRAGETKDSIWTPISRFGDIGGMLGGSIGSNLLGFTSSCVAPDGGAILGIGFGGSFHMYTNSVSKGEAAWTRWLTTPFLTGHHDAVIDLCWTPNCEDGEYFVSVSSDQTCRMFAPIKHHETGSESSKEEWCEISRPQIHGYNLTSVCLAPKWDSEGSTSDVAPCFTLYSGGDEKMVRVFDAPTSVLQGMSELCGIDTNDAASSKTKVHRAFIPELGLSNKASELMNDNEKDELG